MNKKILFATILALTVAIGLCAQMPWGWTYPKSLDQELKRLGLSPPEVQALKELRSEYQEKTKPILEAVKDLEAELKKALKAEKPDKAAYEKIVKDIAGKRAELEMLRIEMVLKAGEAIGNEKAAKILKTFQDAENAFKNRNLPPLRNMPFKDQRRFLQLKDLPLQNWMQRRKK
jgi:Spy/CpxP family protein refolding chaperone